MKTGAPRLHVVMCMAFMLSIEIVAANDHRDGNLRPGVQDIFREAIWGSGDRSPSSDGAHTEKRMHQISPKMNISTSLANGNMKLANDRIAELEIPFDGRTNNGEGKSNGYCYVGSCCGWGHRLIRQAKAFAYVHYLQNRTMLMEWGPCPNQNGQAGRKGKDRREDFSRVMLQDSIDIINFEDNMCGEGDKICKSCGSGNDLKPQRWAEVGRHFGVKSHLGTGTSSDITADSFFGPFQYFIRRLLTQLKPELKQQIKAFIAENFGDGPVVAVHHRHGNGELDDFTGVAKSRANRDNEKVVDWMVETTQELAAAYGLESYKVFFASDSPAMGRMFRARDHRVFIYDQEGKEQGEGKGFIMPGWQGWGRSPGVSALEKYERCEEDAIRAFLDMALLGYADMLVLSKRSTFTFVPSVMMAARQKPVCMLTQEKAHEGKAKKDISDEKKHVWFTCRTTQSGTKKELAKRRKGDTGLAASSRRVRKR